MYVDSLSGQDKGVHVLHKAIKKSKGRPVIVFDIMEIGKVLVEVWSR